MSDTDNLTPQQRAEFEEWWYDYLSKMGTDPMGSLVGAAQAGFQAGDASATRRLLAASPDAPISENETTEVAQGVRRDE